MMWTTLHRSDNGTSAWYEAGHGHPLVFIHGVGLRAEAWQPQLEYFAKSYKVYAWDMPGHGLSQPLQNQQPSLAAFTERLMIFLRDEVQQPAILIGHSMGALLALDCASRYAEFCNGVAALNGVYQRSDVARQAVQLRAQQLRQTGVSNHAAAPVIRWFGESPDDDLQVAAEQCSKWLRQADPNGYADAYQVFADEDGASPAALANIQVPALFLTGADDQNSTAEMAHAMATVTQQGWSQIIGGAGHMAQMTNMNDVNRALQQLVEKSLNCSTGMHHVV